MVTRVVIFCALTERYLNIKFFYWVSYLWYKVSLIVEYMATKLQIIHMQETGNNSVDYSE